MIDLLKCETKISRLSTRYRPENYVDNMCCVAYCRCLHNTWTVSLWRNRLNNIISYMIVLNFLIATLIVCQHWQGTKTNTIVN